jgi:hypothetical protein
VAARCGKDRNAYLHMLHHASMIFPTVTSEKRKRTRATLWFDFFE